MLLALLGDGVFYKVYSKCGSSSPYEEGVIVGSVIGYGLATKARNLWGVGNHTLDLGAVHKPLGASLYYVHSYNIRCDTT